MLKIVLSDEDYDEETETFIKTNTHVIELEHSLVSLSKWESKWEIPFLSDNTRTDEQTLDYIRCMCVNINGDDLDVDRLTQGHIDSINKYITAKMTATTFIVSPNSGPTNDGSFITSELIYYWMIALKIPVSFETWHINRLLTLIKVVNQKSQPAKKMSAKDLRSRQQMLNAQRRQQMGSSG